jgi:MerR family transcriptional regulator, mercuric resistance operon regulatory protein
MNDVSMTIAAIARASGVGIETVRYYERRGLIAQPTQKIGAYRRYDASHAARIRFIKRAQELGFTLDEIESLLELQDGTDRRSIRAIASRRLEDIRQRLQDLKRMQSALAHVLQECEAHSAAPHCPIIESIGADASAVAERRAATKRGIK